MNRYISFFYVLFLLIISAENSTAQYSAKYRESAQTALIDTPKVVEGQDRFFQLGNIYVGPQPDETELKWFAENGVKLVINTRTDTEIEEHTKANYDEAGLSVELGMNYLHLPLGGKAGYSPEDVDTLVKYLSESEKKTLVHCLGGGRAVHLIVAYLIRFRNVPIDDAVDIGRKMKMRIPFEDMLDFPVTRKHRADKALE